MPLAGYGDLDLVLPDYSTNADDNAWGEINNEAHQRIADTLGGIFPPARFAGTATAKIQAAIDAAYADGGGVVQLDGPVSITEPIIQQPNVHIIGRGSRTVLTAATDFGEHFFLLDWDPATPSTTGTGGSIQNLTLNGPGGGLLPAIGSRNTMMGGIRLPAQTPMNGVVAQYFGEGLSLPCNHNFITDCYFQSNWDGIVLPQYPTTGGAAGGGSAITGGYAVSGGDHRFVGGGSIRNKQSSVNVKPSNGLFSTLFDNFKFAYGPIGFYREAGNSWDTMLASILLRGSSFENYGNAVILDESTGTGTGANTMVECTIEREQAISSTNALYRDAARQIAATCVVRNVRNYMGSVGHLAFAVPGGGTNVWQYNGVVQGGNLERRSPAGITGTIPPAAGAYIRGTGAANGWSVQVGEVMTHARYLTSGTVSAGDLLEYIGNQTVRPLASGNFAGVAVTDGAAVGDIVMVASAGQVSVLVNLGASVAVGAKLYRLAGTTHQASSVVNGDCIGVAMKAGSSGAQTPVATRP